MMKPLYSIRMRAAQGGPHESGGHHISGAERIVTMDQVGTVAQSLVDRALHHSKGVADFINITVDLVPTDSIRHISVLDVEEHETSDVSDAHLLAKKLLEKTEITSASVDKGVSLLCGLSTSMRGAMLIDSVSGERIDEGQRGVRVSHMDTCSDLSIYNMNEHMREALVLASKVQSCEGIVGELCWSDDPDYTVGYVACDGVYHRLPHMKEMGSSIGGRIFFVKTGTDISKLIAYLESAPVLVEW